MTAGLSAANLANAWLNTIRGGGAGTNFTADAALYMQLHTGDPGASGTANLSAVTGRQAVTLGAAAAGAIALSNAPAYTMTATETITHVSIHNATSAGVFRWSAALTTPKAVVATDTLNFNTLGVSLTPIAA